MKLSFQPRVAADLRWFRRYFGEGHEAAQGKYFKTLGLLLDTPHMGRPIEGGTMREYVIPRIPFSVIYRIEGDTIVVLRIWDQRADRAALWRGA